MTKKGKMLTCLVRREDYSAKRIPEWDVIELQGTLKIYTENIETSVTLAERGQTERPCSTLSHNPISLDSIEKKPQEHLFAATQLGDLSFNAKGNPVLQIENNELEGRIVTLKRKFAVLKTVTTSVVESANDLMTTDEVGDDPRGTGNLGSDLPTKTEFIVKGIVTRKLLFNKRPIPKGKKRFISK